MFIFCCLIRSSSRSSGPSYSGICILYGVAMKKVFSPQFSVVSKKQMQVRRTNLKTCHPEGIHEDTRRTSMSASTEAHPELRSFAPLRMTTKTKVGEAVVAAAFRSGLRKIRLGQNGRLQKAGPTTAQFRCASSPSRRLLRGLGRLFFALRRGRVLSLRRLLRARVSDAFRIRGGARAPA